MFFLHPFSFRQFFDYLKPDLQLIEHQNALIPVFEDLLPVLMRKIGQLMDLSLEYPYIVVLIENF